MKNNIDKKSRVSGDVYDAVIVGGGASGLAAAIELGIEAPEFRVAILEKNDELGCKIRATGSGRCNIANVDAEGYKDIMSFFGKIGLVTRAYDNGLVYPYSESAADVTALLDRKARELGIEIITGAEVRSVQKREDIFEIEYIYGAGKTTHNGNVCSSNVILATGGKAGPTFGTTGDGYKISRELGHTIVTAVPVLTSVECREWQSTGTLDARTLGGTRMRGRISLYKDITGLFEEDTKIFEEMGEIQFTKYGLSGICVFNMTRFMRYNKSAGETLEQFRIKIDLFSDGHIEDHLSERRKSELSGEKISDVLCTVLKENIAEYVIKYAEEQIAGSIFTSGRPVSTLTDEEIASISDAVHQLTFCPIGIRGWKDAQATAGGVSVEEVDLSTFESRLCTGLYITGELLDRDYPCGGYNLSNAWLTGILSARDISKNASL